MTPQSVTDHDAPERDAVTASASQAMTAAERARRYRERKKAGAGKPHGNGSWPPFEPGNEVALIHGARSPRRVDPLAAQIVSELLDDPATPDYLRNPICAPSLAAWGRAEAIVRLLWDYIAEHDLDTAFADRTETDEEVRHSRGRSARRTVSRNVESALTQFHRHETRAMNLRARLGLDPLSQGRLGRAVAASRVDMARLFQQLQQAEIGGTE